MNKLMLASAALAAGILLSVSACVTGPASPTPTPTPSNPTPISGPGGDLVVNSDSVISAQIQSINKETTGYPWEVDILVTTSASVGSLPNPTKDSIGKVIIVKTDQDMSAYKVGDSITAKVKYIGDTPKPGIMLYMYNIALEKTS